MSPFTDPRASLPWLPEPGGPGVWLHVGWMETRGDSDATAWPVHLATAGDVAAHVRQTREHYSAEHGWQHMWLRLDALLLLTTEAPVGAEGQT